MAKQTYNNSYARFGGITLTSEPGVEKLEVIAPREYFKEPKVLMCDGAGINK